MELYYITFGANVDKGKLEEVKKLIESGLMELYTDDEKWAFFDEQFFEVAKYELELRNVEYEY